MNQSFTLETRSHGIIAGGLVKKLTPSLTIATYTHPHSAKRSTVKSHIIQIRSCQSSMAQEPPKTTESTKYAVVTGANKGIGLEICKQLASRGVTVVLTARNERRGLEAIEKLKEYDFCHNIIFHQLNIDDAASVDSLAIFIKSQFGRLDILVNNAGVFGAVVDADAYRASTGAINWNEIMTQTYDMAEECVKTNYYGTKRTVEPLLPLLQLSNSPRIVNVSSNMGQLERIPSEWAKSVLNDIENLTEESIDHVLNEFLKDFKEGSLEAKGWPLFSSAYTLAKAALNAYTRILAKKYPRFRINCVHPGYVKTDMTQNTGPLTAEEGAEGPVMVALLPDDGPSGLFFDGKELFTCF